MQPIRLGELNPQLVKSVNGAALMAQHRLDAVEQLTRRRTIHRQAGGCRTIPPVIEQTGQALLGGFELAADVGTGARSSGRHGAPLGQVP
jgi:hypothetical protein